MSIAMTLIASITPSPPPRQMASKRLASELFWLLSSTKLLAVCGSVSGTIILEITIAEKTDKMDAISKYFMDYSPSVAAVLAGNDMLCVSDYTQTYNDILEAISNGTIDIDLVDHAATRIIAWKMSKGLL